ncbi:hypothetical protein DE146DRAFT_756604 [Phaeosphaeria sp. MPI-PUGE-AT-0046c]|nr:hypothetical protein DE146DRAFT_756604 [Phaeosphaeria sp. MPI-PUGE-AT-0046c]
MSLGALRKSSECNKSTQHVVVYESEVSSDKELDFDKDKDEQQAYDACHRAAGTVWIMMAPYALAFTIAATHFALHTYLHEKRVNVDTSFPQSGVSAIGLVLVNTFRLAICFSLGVAFTQILSRRLSLQSMRLGDYDRLQHLQNDLQAWLHPKIHRVVPMLSIIAIFGWLVSVAMILPSGSLTVEPKEFVSTSNQRVPTFNSSSAGNGTYASAFETLLGTQIGWKYVCTKRPVLATAKGTLVSRDVAASISPCGSNCTFTTPFYGPAVKCNTTILNETISIDTPADGVYRPPVYTGGWSTVYSSGALDTTSSSRPGWINTDNKTDDHIDTFFVAQHTVPPQTLVNTSTQLATYNRSTTLTTCKLHRSMYTLKTVYENGHRTLAVSTQMQDDLESLWLINNTVPDYHSSDLEPINESTRLEVTNLFALVDGLVQALAGQYYPNTILSNYPSLSSQVTESDPRIGYLRANQTIIADSSFNTASYDFSPRETFSDAFDLDLSEDRINEALQNITLSVMYTLNWWQTHTNVSRTLTQNIFSFSSRPRLVVPYVASLIFTIPFLALGIIALGRNGEAVAEPGFIRALMTTVGSEGLREVVRIGRDGERDVRETRIRYGYVLGEDGMRKVLGLEDEVVELEEKIGKKSKGPGG